MDSNIKREYLFRKQRGKKNLSKYMEEIHSLLDITMGSFKILGLEESDKILKQLNENIGNDKRVRHKLHFEQKEQLLNKFILECANSLHGKVYMFTVYSQDCGLLLVENIKMLKRDFKYSDEHAGIISIISENLRNKLLLDFYEEKGILMLEIEIYGNDWNKLSNTFG